MLHGFMLLPTLLLNASVLLLTGMPQSYRSLTGPGALFHKAACQERRCCQAGAQTPQRWQACSSCWGKCFSMTLPSVCLLRTFSCMPGCSPEAVACPIGTTIASLGYRLQPDFCWAYLCTVVLDPAHFGLSKSSDNTVTATCWTLVSSSNSQEAL